MPNLPELEEKILAFWKEHDIFQKTLQKPAPAGRFVFFEGPPTANGKPGIHHVLARAFKDLIPRYKTMRGFRVDRKAGWDTQGLPVELQVEKELGFKGKPDIEKYGIKEFNAKCKSSVWTYKADWEKLTERIGFWLDLDKPYITYENYYIESLWWILKQVNKAGFLYQDYKVLPHCPRCGTALSSHEVALGYKSVTEPSVYVKFKVKEKGVGSKEQGELYILSWTTTPWTLPGNVALAVGNDIEYVVVKLVDYRKDDGSLVYQYIILAKDIYEKSKDPTHPLYDKIGTHLDYGHQPEGLPDKSEFVEQDTGYVVQTLFGKDLVGLEYEPLFDIKPLQTNTSYKVYAANFVTTTDGTGVVHTAVMYGEDDFVLGTQIGLPKYHTVDEAGNFTKEVAKWAGKFVKDNAVEQGIVADLQERGLLFKQEMYTHDYPFCWRCSTPLLYYAKPSWFIKMSALRDDLKSANEKINWHPEHIQHGRFGEWLEGVKDWAISRERYWGTPLPIWKCEKCKEIIVVESLKELAKLSGEKRVAKNDFDLHRPFIDEITIQCKCGGIMKRVPEVADCWFDSGSMPFAQWGYPNLANSQEQIANSYPADYIAEAIDQTRGWFYTLLAIATLLKKSGALKEIKTEDVIPPYKHVICLGHINDKTGQKMSKSKGNIIDPWEVINKYGADALRFHLYTGNQPGEPKNFDPQAVDDVVKKTLLILMNCLSFYELYQNGKQILANIPQTKNILDKWVLALWYKTLANVTKNLDNYTITEAGRDLANFVTEFSTWYVRRSRDRFKQEGDDKQAALQTLGFVLRQFTITIAPFMPFVAEELYQRIKGGQESVHLEDWPEVRELEKVDEELLTNMDKLRNIVEQALAKRAEAKIKVRQPLRRLLVKGVNFSEELQSILADEINVLEIIQEDGLTVSVELDTKLDDELKSLGTLREFSRQINALRKKLGFTVKDTAELVIAAPEDLQKILEKYPDEILKATLTHNVVFVNTAQPHEFEVDGIKLSVGLVK